jgi:hypothetical protein
VNKVAAKVCIRPAHVRSADHHSLRALAGIALAFGLAIAPRIDDHVTHCGSVAEQWPRKIDDGQTADLREIRQLSHQAFQYSDFALGQRRSWPHATLPWQQ